MTSIQKTDPSLESLFPIPAHGIEKIAVEPEAQIFHFGIEVLSAHDTGATDAAL
jgi:hypothetical protein